MPPRRLVSWPAAIAFVFLCSLLMLPAQVTSPGQEQTARTRLGILIVAPHPDDEVIGCAGVILQALQRHQQVGVAWLTHGDAHLALTAVVAHKEKDQLLPDDFAQAGALRQRHALKAMSRLGVPQDNLMFLGYPDSALEKIYHSESVAPWPQPFTKRTETYGLTLRDYHSLAHGKPAPYARAAVIGDLAEIIRERQPREIYVTHEADKHPDHRAASWFVREAAHAVNFQGDLFAYVVHGSPPTQPPDRRVVLTEAQIAIKRAALQDHQAGTSPVHDHLADEFTKPEEWFWKISLDNGAAR